MDRRVVLCSLWRNARNTGEKEWDFIYFPEQRSLVRNSRKIRVDGVIFENVDKRVGFNS